MKKLGITMLLMVFSQSFAQHEIKKYSINSGATVPMKGGHYEMQSSIGQVDANDTSVGGDFSLSPGYWHENRDLIFKNDF
jgi:hypothetical protein